MQYHLTEDATVYAAFNTRVTAAPAWLSGWEHTDLTFANTNDVQFTVYAKRVKAGETVELGANGQASGCVNYTILVVKEAPAPTEPETSFRRFGRYRPS